MQSNLRTTKYANGDPIPTTDPYNLDIVAESTPQYQWAYEGDDSKTEVYGRLYTWFTVTDSRNICPTGWHVPTDADWTVLEENFIASGYNFDGSTTGNKIGKALASSTTWDASTVIGSIGKTDYPDYRNKSGFSAYPSGFRSLAGLFLLMGKESTWWSSTVLNDFQVYIRNLGYNRINLYRGESLKLEESYAVRCIKD